MEILDDYGDLVGKKIVFSHMDHFEQHFTLATGDGCILIASLIDYNDCQESNKIKVLNEYFVLKILNDSEWMLKELSKLGIYKE